MKVELTAAMDSRDEYQVKVFGRLLIELAHMAPTVDIERATTDDGNAFTWTFDILEGYVEESYVRQLVAEFVSDFNAVTSRYPKTDPRYAYLAWQIKH